MLELEKWIYVGGFAVMAVLVVFGQFGFDGWERSHRLGREDLRFLFFTLFWFVALPGWLVYRTVRRHRKR